MNQTNPLPIRQREYYYDLEERTFIDTQKVRISPPSLAKNKVVIFPKKTYKKGDYVGVFVTSCTSATLMSLS